MCFLRNHVTNAAGLLTLLVGETAPKGIALLIISTYKLCTVPRMANALGMTQRECHAALACHHAQTFRFLAGGIESDPCFLKRDVRPDSRVGVIRQTYLPTNQGIPLVTLATLRCQHAKNLR